MFSRIKHAIEVMNPFGILKSDDKSSGFEKYIKTLPVTRGCSYLVVIERHAISMATLKRLSLSKIGIAHWMLLLVNSPHGVDCLKLYEFKPKDPVNELTQERLEESK